MRKLLAAFVLLGALVLPLPAAQAANPRFQIRCQSSHLAQEDPIVAPGMPSAHMHEFFGNETTNKDSTYQSMVRGETTCSADADTAGYWVPTLLSADGQRVHATSLLLYYRGAAGERTVAFPPDLRMVSNDVVAGISSSNLIVKFPSCWDGVHTDSTDHISHMANPTGMGCPSSHPVRVPALTEVVRYPVNNVSGLRLSSGPLSTMHADFWNTWAQPGLETLVDRCLNNSATSCPRIDGGV